MISEINQMLSDAGSNFRTDDGVTLVAHIGHLKFLKKTFSTISETMEFVKKARFVQSV